MFPYDTLLGKEDANVQRELDQLARATHLTLENGHVWLQGQLHPLGPIMSERNMALVYKTVWGLWSGGHAETVDKLLDWIEENALQPNGDLFFPEEPGPDRDGARLYRSANILRGAAIRTHSLARNQAVMLRLHQYQDPFTGGVFSYIGENPEDPVLPERCNVLECSFFGEYAIAAQSLDAAVSCGNWLVSLVEQNKNFMHHQGLFYWHADRHGRIDTEVGSGEEFGKILSSRPSQANQPGWVTGCCMAFLSDLYHALRVNWDWSHERARIYLDAALELLDYEATMPLETYLFPSKCKVSWGAGQLLSVLLTHELGDVSSYDKLYRVGKRTFLYTFLGTQLADGGWAHEFYPLSTYGPEITVDYRTMHGSSAAPGEEYYADSQTSTIVPAIEITAEFLAELQSFADAIEELRSADLARHMGAAGIRAAGRPHTGEMSAGPVRGRLETSG